MKPAQINLHIETLLLRNLPYGQRHHIAVAIEQELTRLFTEYGLPPALAGGGNIPQITIDALPVEHNVRPSAIGTQIAQKMYISLSGNEHTASTENSKVPG
jgi:hypothetical protein